MSDIRDVLRERFVLLCQEYMERENVSRAELARRMDVSPQKMDKLFKLQLQVRFQEAQLASEFFNVSISWLCGESEIRERLSPELQRAIKQLLDKT